MQRVSSEKGFDDFVMDYWKNLKTPLEKEVLEQLLVKLVHVKGFGLAGMNELAVPVRSQLVEFAIQVIEQHESPMKMMHFNNYIMDTTPTALEERLFHTICCS